MSSPSPSDRVAKALTTLGRIVKELLVPHNVIFNTAEIFRSFVLHFQMHASNYLHAQIE
jgi:hypothetical protein